MSEINSRDEAGDNAYPKPEHGWTCFHCGETFKTPGAARDHFGFEPSADPACKIKIGAERGLVMALRKAERDCEELRRLLHDESCEAYRLYAAQTTRHNAQIMAAEEAGYERGLADGRATPTAEPDEGLVEKARKHIQRYDTPKDNDPRRRYTEAQLEIALAAVTPSIRAKALEEAGETGWLIEHADQPKWLTLRTVEAAMGVDWTSNSLEAVRFCRRSDAEDYVWAHFGGDGPIRITEHRWV